MRDGGLLAQCSSSLRSHCRDSRTSKLELVMNSSHRLFLGLCCASDSVLAAVKVKHPVAIRVICSPEDLQLVSTAEDLQSLLRGCEHLS